MLVLARSFWYAVQTRGLIVDFGSSEAMFCRRKSSIARTTERSLATNTRYRPASINDWLWGLLHPAIIQSSCHWVLHAVASDSLLWNWLAEAKLYQALKIHVNLSKAFVVTCVVSTDIFCMHRESMKMASKFPLYYTLDQQFRMLTMRPELGLCSCEKILQPCGKLYLFVGLWSLISLHTCELCLTFMFMQLDLSLIKITARWSWEYLLIVRQPFARKHALQDSRHGSFVSILNACQWQWLTNVTQCRTVSWMMRFKRQKKLRISISTWVHAQLSSVRWWRSCYKPNWLHQENQGRESLKFWGTQLEIVNVGCLCKVKALKQLLARILDQVWVGHVMKTFLKRGNDILSWVAVCQAASIWH